MPVTGFNLISVATGLRPVATVFNIQQSNKFHVIFAAVKRIRTISPVISLFLITLMLAGSFGFTLIHHTCFHCGTDETTATLTVDPIGDNCCGHHKGAACSHGECDVLHQHSTSEMILSDDCCTHETERIMTDELVRSEVQNEIIPYFVAATVVAVIGDQPVREIHSFASDKPAYRGRDLTTILCRLQS